MKQKNQHLVENSRPDPSSLLVLFSSLPSMCKSPCRLSGLGCRLLQAGDYRFPMYPSWADNECACPSLFSLSRVSPSLPCPLLSLPAPRSKIITVKSTIIMGDFAPERKKGRKERKREERRREREKEGGRRNYTQEETAKAASGEIGSNVANGSRMLGPRREKMIGVCFGFRQNQKHDVGS